MQEINLSGKNMRYKDITTKELGRRWNYIDEFTVSIKYALEKS